MAKTKKKYRKYKDIHRIVNGVKEKLCSVCPIWKSLDKFNKCTASKDKHYSTCKVCQKKYRQNHQGERKKYQHEYRQTLRGKENSRKRSKVHRNTLNGYLTQIYISINEYCNNPNNPHYKNYGGRGIKCLFKSLNDFRNYIKFDMGITDIKQIKVLQINRIDTLGNYEKGNLRFVTSSQNNTNSRKRKTHCGRPCSSRFKGVSWYWRTNKWIARIMVDGKPIYLGCSNSEIQCAQLYDAAAVKHFGEFACTNETLELFDNRLLTSTK